MIKYLEIPITATGETFQLVAINGVIAVEQASTTTVTLAYNAAGPVVATLTLGAAMAANDNTVRDAVQDAMITALQTGWTSPKFRLSLEGLEDAAAAQVTITGIVVA
tara:strand:+ start:1175 stop:1495 length:321 start_codon:yes stop_codon:yes gene_type:complete